MVLSCHGIRLNLIYVLGQIHQHESGLSLFLRQEDKSMTR
jgi:hypothetical protein